MSWGMSLRRNQRGQRWWIRSFVDPLALTGGFATGRSRTELSRTDNHSYNLGASYNLQLPRRGPTLQLGGIVDGLPRWIRESQAGTGMRTSTLALAPTSIRLTSGLTRNENAFTSYRVVVARPDDSLRVPTLNLNHAWRNSAGLTFRPLGMLTLDGTMSSTRDLRHYSDTTPLGRLTGLERRDFLGLDVGVEKDRQVGTMLGLAPRVSTWFRPRYARTSSFVLVRNLTTRDPVRVEGDSGAFLLPQTYNNLRSNELGASVDLNRVVALLAGDSSGATAFFRRLRPLDVTVRNTRSSSFDLATFDPSLGYILATGDRDEFLSQGGQQAIGVSEQDESRVAAGADLPGGFTFTTSLADLESRTFSRVGSALSRTVSRQREWPQGTARWNRLLRRGPVAVLGLGANFRRREGSTVSASAAGDALSRTTTSVFNPDLLLGLRSGITVNLSFSRSGQLSESAANETENVTDQWSGSLSHTIRLPASISATRRPLRASFNGQHYTSTSCLRLDSAPEDGCRTVADLRRLTLSGGVTTDVLPTATAGLNFQYVSNDVRHLDQKTTQLSIVASLRVQLSTGDLR